MASEGFLMLSNKVEFGVYVKDHVSDKLAKMTERWKRQSKEFDKVHNKGKSVSFPDLGRQMFGSIGSAGVIAGIAGVTAALAGAAGAAAYLGVSLAKAAQTETSVIAASSNIAGNIGLTIAAARESYERIEGQLARDAAILPGDTSDYGKVLNGLGLGLSRAYEGDQSGFEAAAADMSMRAGVLASTQHADAQQAGSTLNRAILGTSGLGELRVNDVFQKTGLVTRVEDELALIGKQADDWMQLTTRDRADIMQKALKAATPDEMIAEFSDTAESITQGWKSSLFEPLNGLFGVRRKLATMGDRSTLDSFTEALVSIDRAVKRLMQAFKNAGIDFDPMEAVIKGFDWLSKQANRVTIWLGHLERGGFFKKMAAFDASKLDARKIGARFGDWLYETIRDFFKNNSGEIEGSQQVADVLNTLFAGIGSALDTFLRRLDKGISNLALEAWRGFVDSASRVKQRIGSAISSAIDKIVEALDSAARNAPRNAARAIGKWVPEWAKRSGTGDASWEPGVGRNAQPAPLRAPDVGPRARGDSANVSVSLSGHDLSDPESNANLIVKALNSIFAQRQAAAL